MSSTSNATWCIPGPREARNRPTGESSSSGVSSSTPSAAHEHRGRLDALIGHRRAVLELGAEQPLVRPERLVEVSDRNAEVMDAARVHTRDANDAGLWAAGLFSQYAGEVRCPSCATENEAGRKFCGECGSPLAFACPACGAANAPA